MACGRPATSRHSRSVWFETDEVVRRERRLDVDVRVLPAAVVRGVRGLAGRRSVFDGMQAQDEGPPLRTSSPSTTATRNPPSANAPALGSPGAPAPTTMTS